MGLHFGDLRVGHREAGCFRRAVRSGEPPPGEFRRSEKNGSFREAYHDWRIRTVFRGLSELAKFQVDVFRVLPGLRLKSIIKNRWTRSCGVVRHTARERTNFAGIPSPDSRRSKGCR